MPELEIGKTYDIMMKPTIMRKWKIIGKSKKCFKVTKAHKGTKLGTKGGYYTLIPMKLVLSAREIK